MVEQLELGAQHVICIAELIDMLLSNLVKNWQACNPSGYLVSANYHGDPHSLTNNQSSSEFLEDACESIESGAISHAIGLKNSATLDDESSDMSYISATSNDWNDTGSSIDLRHDMDVGSDNNNSKVSDSRKNNGGVVGPIVTDNSPLFSLGNDTELIRELERIEREYQDAMRQISRRREEAIMEARRRLSVKTMDQIH